MTNSLQPKKNNLDQEPEPALMQTWKAWKADKTPDTHAAFMTELTPIIDRAAATHVKDVNPLVRSRARRMAMDAADSYDPKMGASLSTHVHGQLRGLKRYAAQTGQMISIPERVSLDKRTMNAAHAELSSELSRDPTDDELADRTGIPHSRLHYIRKFNSGVNEGQFDRLNEQNEGQNYTPAVASRDSNAWLHVVYDELSPSDKKIFEHTIGWNGHPKLSNQQIAAKLRLTPGAISQRKANIQRMLDAEDTLSPFGT